MRKAADWLKAAAVVGSLGGASPLAWASDETATWTPPTKEQCENPKLLKQDVLLTLAQCCVKTPQFVDGGKGCAAPSVGKPEYYSLLHDSNPSKKGADLLIPTDPVTGVEAKQVLEEPWDGYFDEAWRYAGSVLKRGRKTALAVNSKPARDDNQLHIHIGCVDASIRDELAKAKVLTDPKEVKLNGHAYKAVFVKDITGDHSPFKLVDRWVGSDAMPYQGIAVVGAVKEDHGKVVDDDGYFILDTAGKTKAEGGLAESVIDYSLCKN